MSTGTCRHCGHSPVGQDAIWCPNCRGTYPNASRTTGCVTRLLAVVVAAGFLIFAGLVIALIINFSG